MASCSSFSRIRIARHLRAFPQISRCSTVLQRHALKTAPVGVLSHPHPTRRLKAMQFGLGADDEILPSLQKYADQEAHPVTITQLIQFGRNPSMELLKMSAQFLHKELLIRYSQRILDLDNIPAILAETQGAQEVKETYLQAVVDLQNFPCPETDEEVKEFTELCRKLKARHSNIVETMASGLMELKQSHMSRKVNFVMSDDLTGALDRMYSSRIGTRLLMGQLIALQEDAGPGSIGIVHENTDPRAVVREVYGDSPEIIIEAKEDFTFPYIPSHLHHIMMELLKNAVRAVMDAHPVNFDEHPVRVTIAIGKDDLSIRVSDTGMGIPRSDMPKIWNYLYTTAYQVEPKERTQTPPLAGFGFGLPLARLYAQYFGGDIEVSSMDGYGTDAYLYLNHSGMMPEDLYSAT